MGAFLTFKLILCKAGTKKRSSDFWIKIGLEWLPRFLKEPRRLWERNLKSTPTSITQISSRLFWVKKRGHERAG